MYRVAANLSQAELADAAGVSRETVSNIERRVRPAPHRLIARALAEALGVDDVAELFPDLPTDGAGDRKATGALR